MAAAYAFSKLRPVFGNVILAMMLATLMIPAAVLVVPQYLTVLDLPILHLNLIGTPWAIWLPSVANAFSIFLLKRFFDSIPRDLMDAAVARRGLAAADTALGGAADFAAHPRGGVDLRGGRRLEGLPLADAGRVPDPSKQTLNVGIYSRARACRELSSRGARHRRGAHTSHLPVFQRNIMAGLTAGSLKG